MSCLEKRNKRQLRPSETQGYSCLQIFVSECETGYVKSHFRKCLAGMYTKQILIEVQNYHKMKPALDFENWRPRFKTV